MRLRRKVLQWTKRVALALPGGIAVFMLASYAYGELYASQTGEAQIEVWSAYLNHELRNNTSEDVGQATGPLVVVVRNRTQNAYRHWLLALAWPATSILMEPMRQRLPDLQTDTTIRYTLGNLRPHDVRTLKYLGSYQLASNTAVSAYGDEAHWRKLYPHSPGYFVLSSVGFNWDQTQALFHVNSVCGLCGYSAYVLLRKVNGQWVVEEVAATSVS